MSDEFTWCVRCGANLRYELLAQEIRQRFGRRLSDLCIVEFDPGSPLRSLLSSAPNYIRTFFSDTSCSGAIGLLGARCEDVTQLTFPDSSVDLMISSDVLEHVIDLERAFAETARVLAEEGVHLFTVPYRDRTKRRVGKQNEELIYLDEPEYHWDPLNPKGILTAWDIGPDLPEYIRTPGLELGIVSGPIGPDRRVVWMAKRRSAQIFPTARGIHSQVAPSCVSANPRFGTKFRTKSWTI